MFEFLNVGYDVYINISKIRIIAPITATKLRKELKRRELDRSSPQCFDATYGKESRAIIILDDGGIIISATNAETLAKRNTKTQNGGHSYDGEI